MSRALLADDDLDIRVTLGALLEAAGHRVHLASSGVEALELLGAHTVDLAIVDVMMPGMGGDELVREMRARGHDVPVVLISASGDVARVARSLGVYAYLAKPFRIEALEELIASVPCGSSPSSGGSPPGMRERDRSMEKTSGG